MTRYVKVNLGLGNKHAAQALTEGWVGTGWMENNDLTGKFHPNWRDFNKEFIPIVMETDDIKTRIGAGLACGSTHTVCAGLAIGDFIISPVGNGNYRVGTIAGDYYFAKGEPLPQRRKVSWRAESFSQNEVSEDFRRSLGSRNTVSDVSRFGDEIEQIVTGVHNTISVNNEDVENPLSFVLERHLEDFLVSNWAHTELGKHYDIFSVDGEVVGRQYPSDTGPIDILAISKDGSELLVVELKRGRVSDVVVGQILRYMSYVQEIDESKKVRGVIIGTDDDQRFRRALSMTNNIEFFKYEVNFKLTK
jgi:restriction system protein